MNAFATGYLVGLVVGEGSFTADRGSPVLSLKMNDEDPAPLQVLATSLGGKVYGPYVHGGRHYFVYRLRGENLRTAIPVLVTHLPEGSKRRRLLAWARHHGLLGGEGDPFPTRPDPG